MSDLADVEAVCGVDFESFNIDGSLVEIVEIETYSGDEGECQLFYRLMKKNKGSIPVQGFGSSDCRCRAHLFYFQKSR